MAAIDVESKLMTQEAEDTSDVDTSLAEPRTFTRLAVALPLAAAVLACVAYAAFAATHVQQKAEITMSNGGALTMLAAAPPDAIDFYGPPYDSNCKSCEQSTGQTAEDFCKANPGGTYMPVFIGGDCNSANCWTGICPGSPGIVATANSMSAPAPAPASAASCFPGQATIEVRGGGSKPMADLKVGDEILTEAGYEPVLSFIHSVADAAGHFLTVQHEHGEFRVSLNHVVFVADGHGRKDRLAAELVAGDQLVGVKGVSRVLSLRRDEVKLGMYAPLTATGTIVVDGILASNYANIAEHKAAHAAFFFARTYHQFGLGLGLASPKKSGTEELHPLAALLMPLQRLLPGGK